jgi:hypothetical protein
MFGLVERCVGVGGEAVERQAIAGCQCSADSDADVHVATVNHEGGAQGADNSVRK